MLALLAQPTMTTRKIGFYRFYLRQVIFAHSLGGLGQASDESDHAKKSMQIFPPQVHHSQSITSYKLNRFVIEKHS